MLLERFYDDDLAQASYLIGCQATGDAVVVDPRRDVQVYLDTAARNGMRIVAVTETHIHADYLSGTRELARATDAEIFVSGEGGVDWQYGFDATRLHDGDVIPIGNLRLQARHTPGHTPEHLVFLVTDGALTQDPGYLLSGDFVFVGDLGRPDLLDEAAGGQDTRFQGAQDLFDSLKRVLLTLPDHVQIHPAHGSGSACGKALGAIASTTVGYERLYTWWGPYLAADDRDGLVRELLDGQPDAHAYFARMKRENRDGPAVLGPLSELAAVTSEDAAELLRDDEVILVDTRAPADVRAGSVPGALAIPATGKTAAWGAWAVDPEQEKRPLLLLVDGPEQADHVRDHLIRVGIDSYAGYLTTLDGLETRPSATIAPDEVADIEDAFVLDVREASEYAAGHVPGATRIGAGRVLWETDRLPKDRTIISYCQSGARNIIASQALRRAGFPVIEIEGSYLGYSRAQQNADAPTA
ncbi:MBL fold metallo-hydrolase [Rathayibacter sp. AY1G1]|jgi:hydroxyacylglutathione hydrolase|uniref:MBL fold metallo-hydrolase n=1 Tax=Rathayibacter sp. AY1G1 TaxID=2080564 RepID=UPI000CE88EE7|nr:MBL fold metallo-hydrolase [Rathayibacter sp. AY1G1]PPH12580.1 MBL fold metallo-hydrolase [Rathayibacter sp. AY1G1]